MPAKNQFPSTQHVHRSVLLAAAVALLGLAAACQSEIGAVTTTTTLPPVPSTTTTTTTAPPPTTTTTTAPPPTTTTTAPPASGPAPEEASLHPGAEGPEVVALQERLIDLNLWLPAVDGRYGPVTEQAVMAFQKHVGIGRDGIAGPATFAALEDALPVTPVEPGDHVEIDLERQLLIVVAGDRTLAFNTSTGMSGWRTPTGRFTITREIDGMRHAPLGDLWRPKYFNGGIAMHGSPNIPGHPASHGCARLHDDAIDLIWDEGLAPVGTPVLVH